jgi:phenylacetate-coenzyme A ligase PaaK-like adenylate-forming protein
MNPRITPLDLWIAHKIGCQTGLTREALEAYQLEKLRETLRLVRLKSRFYQKRLGDAPHYVSSLRDLTQFPFTTAQDIRELALQFLCVSQDEIQRVVTLDTSGTTGQPKRLYFTKEDQELTIDFFHIGMSTFTGPGDKVLILLPCERIGSVGDLLTMALQRLGAHPIKHGVVRDISETLAVMSEERVDCLVGIPTQVLALARHRDGLKLKSALLTTDHVPDAIARAVECAWGCLVYNHYGMTEMGLGGGVECQARRGYHLREADMIFEIINPATGQPLVEGEAGEVVFTTLTRRGMPLIRYRTGDISRWLTGECPCGTTLKTLERVKSRVSGNVAVGDQWQLTIADLDEALFSIASVLDFSAAISREGAQDYLRLEVRVVERANDNIAGAIDVALESIPAVRLARTSHQLDVVVAMQNTRLVVARPIKRTIMDRRTGA